MAKNIQMEYYNGSSYEEIYPKVLLTNVTGTLPIANGGTGATTASKALSNLGAAASSHNHAASNITSGTLDAARIPTLAANKITSGTFATTGVVAATGTDYATARIRNIQASTTDLTAGSSSLSNGNIYFVYE